MSPMSTAVAHKRSYKVDVDSDTRRKIERIAKRTKLKHIHIVGNAIDAYADSFRSPSDVQSVAAGSAKSADSPE